MCTSLGLNELTTVLQPCVLILLYNLSFKLQNNDNHYHNKIYHWLCQYQKDAGIILCMHTANEIRMRSTKFVIKTAAARASLRGHVEPFSFCKIFFVNTLSTPHTLGHAHACSRYEYFIWRRSQAMWNISQSLATGMYRWGYATGPIS